MPILENPQERLGDQGEWRKGIEKGPGPLVRQCVAAERTGTVHQGDPEGTVNRIYGGKQVHLRSAEGRPNAIHHLWVKPPLPQKQHLPRQKVRGHVLRTRNIDHPEAGKTWRRPDQEPTGQGQ
ncbi:hypothetical protein ATANTOWER_008011 [Ataeniobius toweri]|uniref:Ribosomal protein L2 n=1 Tax=Ataeniobius toweri TaxID=208326 RepID=A0ABU7BHG4_9TELE|nr:hypothetical protein [Ataeniobius toweri]